MKKILSILLSKLTAISVFLLIQFVFLIWAITTFATHWVYISITLQVISFLVVLYLLGKNDNPMFKIAWLIPILVFPIFGGLFYIFFRMEHVGVRSIKRLNALRSERIQFLSKPSISIENPLYERSANYLLRQNWPIYNQTTTKFLPSGNEKLQQLLKELHQAKHFIFMEYYIITKSLMWDQILEVLIQKKNQGVEVKIIYDDFGSSTKLPFGYQHYLAKLGFEVLLFNPLKIHISSAMNYRDHRKIVVIDNKVAFTGGINIGDEYTNSEELFGHWHDAAIMIKGDAVWSLTALFLETWSFITKKKVDYLKYKHDHTQKSDGFIIPFGDYPLDPYLTSRNLYLQLINSAVESIIITTPYLIPDNELISSLKIAAESGVDVSIIIPKMPDNRLVYIVSESYIKTLLSSGVKVYKYTPGFIHSKLILVDDKTAMMGTANLDFRSLYLHFEDNLWLYNNSCLTEMKKYCIETISQSSLVTLSELKKRNIFYKMLQALLRTFAPLM